MTPAFKMKLIAGLLVPAIGLFLAGVASAADGNKPPSGAQSPPTAQTLRDMRASNLIGSEVRNAQGENLGEIKDLIVDVNNDRVYYAVLSFGGVLGFGDKLFAYPVRMFTQAEHGDKLVLNVGNANLKAAPRLDKAHDSGRSDRYGADVDRYFGKPADAQPLPNQLLRRASELIGKDVSGHEGENLGKIGDLVVNIGKGQVRYAVFEFDRPWNVNSTAAMVPLRIFDFSADRANAVVNVDKSNLDNALSFDKNRWPLINNPLFLVDIDRYLILVDPRRYGANGDAEAVFDRLDVNRDNKLSVAEARQDSKVLGAWARVDLTGGGEVTRAEFVAQYNAVTK